MSGDCDVYHAGFWLGHSFMVVVIEQLNVCLVDQVAQTYGIYQSVENPLDP